MCIRDSIVDVLNRLGGPGQIPATEALHDHHRHILFAGVFDALYTGLVELIHDVELYLGHAPIIAVQGLLTVSYTHLEGTAREKYGLGDGPIVLGVANVWEDRKGLRDFCQLAELLPEEYTVALVGLSPQQMEGLPAKIKGIPRTDSTEELAQLYSLAQVFVNPTWEDNFPTTNLEALACGTPVITYATGGSPEALDETCGLTVNKGDVEALARGIQEQRFSREACLARSRRFGKDGMFEAYLCLLYTSRCV